MCLQQETGEDSIVRLLSGKAVVGDPDLTKTVLARNVERWVFRMGCFYISSERVPKKVDEQLVPSLYMIFKVHGRLVPSGHRIKSQPEARHCGLKVRRGNWVADHCSHA